MNKELNQKKWQEIIDNQQSSGMTQKTWCEANDVNLHNFRYWVNRLKTLATETDDVRWVSLEDARPSTKSDIMKITVGRACVEVNQETDKLLLADVLGILMTHVS